MNFLHRATGDPAASLAVFPGTFNPVTVAHRALAEAALGQADEVLLVLPRTFPHKEYSGASFDDRAGMLCALAARMDRVSVASSEKGLFVDIASECRQAYGSQVSLAFLCGRDAAERIANWDYGRPGAFAEMLRQFSLLVAARQGEYAPPDAYRHAVRKLELAATLDAISATEVRQRIAKGEPWEHLVPPEIREQARKVYG